VAALRKLVVDPCIRGHFDATVTTSPLFRGSKKAATYTAPAMCLGNESAGEVHNATNQTTGVAEVLATFLSPEGAQPLIPVPNPGKVCRVNDDNSR
jgi:hypothetical protein